MVMSADRLSPRYSGNAADFFSKQPGSGSRL
jgi:hypothetical protein